MKPRNILLLVLVAGFSAWIAATTPSNTSQTATQNHTQYQSAPITSTSQKQPPVQTFQLPQSLNGYYKNTDGVSVPRPYVAPSIPVGATAKCYDATYSFSQHRQGTCSHHGGVMEWL